jgi:hypothetical protein
VAGPGKADHEPIDRSSGQGFNCFGFETGPCKGKTVRLRETEKVPRTLVRITAIIPDLTFGGDHAILP